MSQGRSAGDHQLRTARDRLAWLHRLDRHPGDRHCAPQPGTLPHSGAWDASLIHFFRNEKKYRGPKHWDLAAINKQKLIDCICRKYLFDFYRAGSVGAARLAFLNQLKLGNLRLNRNYAGIFYNLFIKRNKKLVKG